MNLINAIVRFILRSPVHALLSKNTMLITFTGLKTGRQYTLPVNYVQNGNIITLTSRRHRRWWRNLLGGAPVALNVRGRALQGMAETITEDDASFTEAMLAFYQKLAPQRAAERAARAAQESILIRIRLAE